MVNNRFKHKTDIGIIKKITSELKNHGYLTLSTLMSLPLGLIQIEKDDLILTMTISTLVEKNTSIYSEIIRGSPFEITIKIIHDYLEEEGLVIKFSGIYPAQPSAILIFYDPNRKKEFEILLNLEGWFIDQDLWIFQDMQDVNKVIEEISLYKKTLENKKQEIELSLEREINLEEEWKDTYVTWEADFGGNVKISKYDERIIEYFESVIDCRFFLLDEIKWSDKGVSIRDRKITGLGLFSNVFGILPLKRFPRLILEWQYLEELSLDGNQISELPKEINQLSNLQKFYFSNNQITSIPSSLYSLSNLKVLELSSNNIASISPSIEKLKKLKSLKLDKNYLLNLPDELFSLKSLQKLTLNDNEINELSPKIENLNKLEEFSFGNYNLTSLPESIGDIKSLKTLRLKINKSSQLPITIGKLTSLENFDLFVETPTGLPSSIKNLDKLETMWISSESGKTLPKEILTLKSLSFLYLSGDLYYNIMHGYTPDAQSQEVLDKLEEKNVRLFAR